MANIRDKVRDLYAMERLSANDTLVHRRHPAVKLLAAAVFIVTVASFDRYAVSRMVPYVLYTTTLAALSETPHAMLFKRFLIVSPFCLCMGLSGVLFDRAAAFSLGGLNVSFGVVSAAAILFRAYLCVTALLLLTATTPFAALTARLRRFRVPEIFVTVFEMTYRYVGVLSEEAAAVRTAYALRSANRKGVDIRHMGSLAGRLLLRSFDRAERVYAAMKCRGYGRAEGVLRHEKANRGDILYLCLTALPCVALRVFDLGAWLNPRIGELLR